MKKTLFVIMGILAIVSSANAVDTAQIKAVCQNSGKTLWDEHNQVCIPKNPCKNEKFEAYCNRIYKDVQLKGFRENLIMQAYNGYKLLVEAYAIGHNLSCVPLDTDANALGDDYVICMGKDVMVFQFDDIADDIRYESVEEEAERYRKYNRLVCEAFEGVYADGICTEISETDCNQIENLSRKYDMTGDIVHAYWNDNVCDMFL